MLRSYPYDFEAQWAPKDPKPTHASDYYGLFGTAPMDPKQRLLSPRLRKVLDLYVKFPVTQELDSYASLG